MASKSLLALSLALAVLAVVPAPSKAARTDPPADVTPAGTTPAGVTPKWWWPLPPPPPPPPAVKDCVAPLQNLQQCVPYLDASTDTATAGCCQAYGKVVADAVLCLCHAFNGDMSSYFHDPTIYPFRFIGLSLICRVYPPATLILQCHLEQIPPLPPSKQPPARPSPPRPHPRPPSNGKPAPCSKPPPQQSSTANAASNSPSTSEASP